MKRVGDDTQGATFISGGDFGTSLDSLLTMYAMYRRGVHLDFLESIFDAFGITINRIHTAEAFVRACMSHIPPAINLGAYIEALNDVLLSIDLEYDDLDSDGRSLSAALEEYISGLYSRLPSASGGDD